MDRKIERILEYGRLGKKCSDLGQGNEKGVGDQKDQSVL